MGIGPLSDIRQTRCAACARRPARACGWLSRPPHRIGTKHRDNQGRRPEIYRGNRRPSRPWDDAEWSAIATC